MLESADRMDAYNFFVDDKGQVSVKVVQADAVLLECGARKFRRWRADRRRLRSTSCPSSARLLRTSNDRPDARPT